MPYTSLEMAEAFIKAGELTDALDVLNTHLESQSEDDAARRLRAQLLMRLPGEDHLRQALEEFVALSQPDADDFVYQSVILERTGEADGALQAMAQALKLRQGDERLTERYLGLLMTKGDVDEARALLDTLPQSWRWSQWRGDLAAKIGAHQEANEHYTAALDGLDSSVQFENDWTRAIKARLLLARAQSTTAEGDYESADVDYVRAEELIADDPMIAFNRGLVAALRGDVDGALMLCRGAYASANETLQAHMVAALREDARFWGIEAKMV